MKVKGTIWLIYPTEVDEQANYCLMSDSNNMTGQGWYKVEDVECEFTPPTREQTIPKAVEALRQRQTEIQAEAGRRLTQIDEQIANLLCLTDGTEVSSYVEADDDIPF